MMEPPADIDGGHRPESRSDADQKLRKLRMGAWGELLSREKDGEHGTCGGGGGVTYQISPVPGRLGFGLIFQQRIDHVARDKLVR